ncbi:SgrR family transcriptional regulator [Thaumasiovibrio subtropicus]|uniref:SgrR family transcriptional regulator n=1 Tax=Thaumasiovibrio subtropicus TaxID=1891207 RepID=UPI000B34F225|nr:SgrR family transcriptional regulator [Thaumasiovibrio subtropicus]
MSGSRLKQQFQTLFQHFNGQDTAVTVGELMEVLHCTRRNVRMVMGKLSDEGWITWTPAVGRGKLSQLVFNLTQDALLHADVTEAIQEGRFERALHLLGDDKQKLAAFITEQLGYATVQGRQVLRLPYYRAINPLNPLQPMRRSEHHLARQVFNGLSRFCEKTETIQPDLAHHWKMLSPSHWRFFLRPSVRFHSGAMVSIDDYIASLQRLASFPLFQHFKSVTSPFANIIDIQLNTDDFHLPELLASIEAVILPATTPLAQDGFEPIGTGPYRILQADSQRIKLEAFDHYFGFRALIDEIEIWVLENISACHLNPDINHSPISVIGENLHQPSQYSRLDEGCSYLVLNQCSGFCQQEAWQQYVINRLNPFDIHQQLLRNQTPAFQMIPAYGFMPGWIHTAPKTADIKPPRTGVTLKIAVIESHPIFTQMGDAIRELLFEDGLHCELVTMSYMEFHTCDGKDIDIWLGSINLVSRHPSMIINWLFQYANVTRSVPEQELVNAFEAIRLWRAQEQGGCPAEELLNAFVSHRVIVPLFHTWAGVNSAEQLKGAETNSMGWFDFTSVWVDPDI